MKGKAPNNTTSGTPTIAKRHNGRPRGPVTRPASNITSSTATDAAVATRTERLQGAENSARTSVISPKTPCREGGLSRASARSGKLPGRNGLHHRDFEEAQERRGPVQGGPARGHQVCGRARRG